MDSIKLCIILLLVAFLFLNCSHGLNIKKYRNLVEDVPSQGALCAIKKAYQLTDLTFTPLDSIRANPGRKYMRGKRYKGMIYSSVKETNTFVGIDVSLHTFMTALHNPKSVIYTEKTDASPYHGINCGAYYGAVCNTFVAYALGLRVPLNTADFPAAGNMMLVKDQSSRGVRLADVIHQGGHVRLVTKIGRESVNGNAVELELSEGTRVGCRRMLVTGKELDRNIKNGNWTIYRYKNLDSNTYTSQSDFVAVMGEKQSPFHYNDDICTNRGDKACYVEGDTVVLNIASGFKRIEIYKDSNLFKTIRLDNNATDIILTGLAYGDYCARVVTEDKQSDFTYWKVIDVKVRVDINKKMVYFQSLNSVPLYLEFCYISGVRFPEIFELTKEDISRGYVKVSSFQMTSSQKRKGVYVKVHFQNEYGRVTNKAIKWEDTNR